MEENEILAQLEIPVGAEESVNITPDPRILVAITNNPMKPIDALCELIDNSIDSYLTAEKMGSPITNPLISITIPKVSDINRGEGILAISDNGYGMKPSQLVNSVKAGFTSNNPFDNLGIFGLGFNISTGKLGKRTKIASGRSTEDYYTQITIDLEEIVNKNTFDVPKSRRQKKAGVSGTVIVIDRWWEEGTPNAGFIRKLAKIGIPNIIQEIGRRYSTYIREKNIKIFINENKCEPFEHCVWADNRVVKHNRWGNIPAVFYFNETLKVENRCMKCNGLVELNYCSTCNRSSNIRTIEHRVRGWVGIQRFDDADNYGIDLIRNGRVIRKAEKEAFFTWTDNLGTTHKEYPVDSIYGRIVGEVHIDHVPTDFLKQDFQRTSPEWEEIVKFLRGTTPLRPRAAEQEEDNFSPIYKLFQGYRRVRDFGTKDMYMGYWEPGASKPKRISRDKEREYYLKFLERLPGFYDDTEWWKLVEDADKKPSEIIECSCGYQVHPTTEVCPQCGNILIGKTCKNPDCAQVIAKSADPCPLCGQPQSPVEHQQWKCCFCDKKNHPEATACRYCGRNRGEQNTFDLEYLLENSDKNDQFSITSFSISLPDNVSMSTTPVNVFTLKPGISLERNGVTTPLVCHKGETVNIFVDIRHPVFIKYQVRLHDMIALELAKWIQDQNNRFISGDSQHLWSLSSLCWEILRSQWGDKLMVDPAETRNIIENFFRQVKDELPILLADVVEDIDNNMLQEEKHELALTLVNNGFDPGNITSVIKDGTFLRYLPNRLVVKVFGQFPEKFFDGKFWVDSFDSIDSVFPESTKSEIRSHIKNKYRNFLEDILGYLQFQKPDQGYTKRVNQTLELLYNKLA